MLQGLKNYRNSGDRMRAIFCVCAALTCSFDGRACAHDFWIEPSTFQPKVNEQVQFSLRVGEHFKGDPVPRNPDKMDGFIIRGPHRYARMVDGQDGADPAGSVSIDTGGMYVVGYRSKRSKIELDADKFEQYLKEEGLDRIIALRAERGETGKAGREVYSRAAKVVLNVGEPSAMAMEPNLRYTFEIVPLRNPSTIRVGRDELTVRCMLDGTLPAKQVTVFAMNKSAPEQPLKAETDDEGKATFRLDKTGVWMIKSVYMRPAPADADADWESIWGSLVFEIPSRPTPEP